MSAKKVTTKRGNHHSQNGGNGGKPTKTTNKAKFILIGATSFRRVNGELVPAQF
ncbi:MAG: hypothetical protein Q8P52_02195 [bacterium]|nr:hypothetical protein [bacterium]